MECNETANKQVTTYREKIMTTLKNEGHSGMNRSDTVLRRQGALLGAGLLDAGGRNLMLQLRSPLHCMRREATVCCVIATQMWEWYPLFHLIAKTLTPSALFAVDMSLALPASFSLCCKTDPALFDYVPPLRTEDDNPKNKKSSVQFSFQQTRSSKSTISKALLRRTSTNTANTANTTNTTNTTGVQDGQSTIVAETTKEVTTEVEATKHDHHNHPSVEKEEQESMKMEVVEEEEKEMELVPKPRPTEFEVKNATRLTPLQLPFLELINPTDNDNHNGNGNGNGNGNSQRFVPVLEMKEMKKHAYLPAVMMLRDRFKGIPCVYVGKEEGTMASLKCPEPFIYHIPKAQQ